MYKRKILNIVLVFLPVAAFLLSTTGDSVTIYDSRTMEVLKQSFFEPAEGISVPFLPAFAALIVLATVVVAVICVLGKKRRLLGCLKWLSLIGACVAVSPLLFRGEVVVVPIFLMPLLLLAEVVLAVIAAKADEAPIAELKGERLR